MTALRTAVGSRYAGWAAVLLTGPAAYQGVEQGVWASRSNPPQTPPEPGNSRGARVAVARTQDRSRGTEPCSKSPNWHGPPSFASCKAKHPEVRSARGHHDRDRVD